MSDYETFADGSIRRTADGAWIPADPKNADFQSYQAWRAAGNIPGTVAPVVETKVSIEQRLSKLQLPVDDLKQALGIKQLETQLNAVAAKVPP